MAAIRVGIIGLSSRTGEPTASPGDGWASTAHLPYLTGSPRYEIVALCNSSEEAAKIAVERYKLPATTKTYGTPHDLASDPDIDLVVCCVRVDRHYSTIKPALEAGKDVFVEWPMASNLSQAEELLAMAHRSGSKTIVGLQTRGSPQIQKIRELLKNGTIGTVLSSTCNVQLGWPGDVEPPGITYMTEKDVGGNLHTILFGHVADSVLHALDDIPTELNALVTTQWPKSKLLNSDFSFNKLIDRETPDHVFMQAILPKHQAPISIHIRGGKQFKGTSPIEWQILGSEGQLRVSCPTSAPLNLGGMVIELYRNDTDVVENVEVQYLNCLQDLDKPMAKNIGALYERFATEQSDGFVSFDEAIKLHRLLDATSKSSAARGSVVSVN